MLRPGELPRLLKRLELEAGDRGVATASLNELHFFLVSVEERCDANGELVLALMGEDVMGNAVAGTLTYPLDCGDGGPVDVVLEEEPLACGCRSGVGSNASWTRFVGWLSRR